MRNYLLIFHATFFTSSGTVVGTISKELTIECVHGDLGRIIEKAKYVLQSEFEKIGYSEGSYGRIDIVLDQVVTL
jgi:hypothetical protein